MTTVRRRGLQIDDPLASSLPDTDGKPLVEPVDDTPGTIPQQRAQASTRGSRSRRTQTKPLPATDSKPPPADSGVWRVWSGVSAVGSFRVPHELLVELGDAGRELGLPIGLIVTAGITQLLDQPGDQIAALVDRADDARIHGRRNARRRHHRPTQR